MKAASSTLNTLLASRPSVLVPVEMYQVNLVDGTVLYFTSADAPVTTTNPFLLDNVSVTGGQSYAPMVMQRSPITQKRGVEVGTMELKVGYKASDVVDSGLNLAQTLMVNRWVGATVNLLRAVNPVILANGTLVVSEATTIFVGRAAPSKVTRTSVDVTVHSPLELFDMEMPWRALSPNCRWVVYDVGCTLSKSAFSVNGTVLVGSTASQILCALSQESGHFDLGALKFTSGANLNLTSTVKFFTGSGLANAYPQLVLNDKPLAYYRLNADVNDSTPNGYNGVNHGVTFASSGGPLAGGSGYGVLDGSSSWVDISAIPIPTSLANYLGGVSIEFFFKPATSNQPNGAFGGGIKANQGQYPTIGQFASPTDAAPGFIWADDHPYAGFAVNVNAWNHIVGVWRGSRIIDVYVNGYLYTSVQDQGHENYSWSNPTLGKANRVPPTPTLFAKGQIAEVAIYGYAMDPTQVLTHYAASLSAPANNTNASIYLAIPFPNVPAAGDTFTVVPGCDLSMRRCALFFNNIANYGGVPFMPLIEHGA